MSRAPSRAVTRATVLLPTLLALVAEAAWTAVVAGLLAAFAFRDPAVGIGATLLAALAGLVAARVIGPRLGDRWPWTAVLLALASGLLGWLAAAEVRSVVAARGIDGAGEALLANPGGWMTGAAFVRGIAQSRIPADPHAIGTALGIGVPGLALMAVLGGMVADPARSRFLADAQAGVLVFLVAGILALALSRQTLLGSGSGLDWRRNPAWLALLAMLLAGVAVAAVSASLVVGPVIVTVLGVAVPSLLLVGLVVGFDRRSLRILVASMAVALLVAAVLRAMGARPSPEAQIPGIGVTTPGDPNAVAPLAIGVLVIVLLAATIAILVLARLWMRRPRAAEDDLLETRWIDHGEVSEQPRTGRRRRGIRFGRPAPADAVAAYRALIEELASRPRVRREPGETPAEHAGRLRRSGVGALSLDLLAADYGLVRYGGVTLTGAEDRRAIGRAARLRRRLVAAVGGAPTPGAGAAREPERPGDAGTPGEAPGARARYRVG
ncbi:MAG: DUF4129 domain-containing protein [Chloroflexota bacterium]